MIKWTWTALLAGCIQLQPLRLAHDPRLKTDPAVQDCTKLNNEHIAATATAAGLGVLSGSGGVASLLTSNIPRYVVGGISLGLSTVSAVVGVVASGISANYVHECTQNTGATQ